MSTILKNKFPDTYISFSPHMISRKANEISTLNSDLTPNTPSTIPQSTRLRLLSTHSPLVVATDGSHKISIENQSQSSSCTAIVLNGISTDTPTNQNSYTWESKTTKPILARSI